MKTKAELKAARDEKSARRTLARLRGEETQSKNHHGFIVTSPRGSVSLLNLPVPRHESIKAASDYGKASGKPFVITEAAKFYRTGFGRMVQALEHKRALARPRIVVGTPAIKEAEQARKPNPLTNLLSRLKASAQERRFESKVAADTPKPPKPADIVARQMRTTGQALDMERDRLADKSYLLQAMAPPKDTKIHHASDSDLISLYMRQDAATQRSIDTASKFRWDKRRVNKLVKTGTIVNLLILFRAGRLPDKCRTYKSLLREINK